MTTEQKRLYAIGAFRSIGGLSTWIAPDLLARVYGGKSPDAQGLLWSRLAGTREAALAAGPLLSGGENRRRWLQLGLVCDFADIGATLFGNRTDDRLSRRSIGLALATFSVSALLTLATLRSMARGSVTGPEARGASPRPELHADAARRQ